VTAAGGESSSGGGPAPGGAPPPRSVTVRVPATSANLGPGFDCLAVTLDLWNEATLTLAGDGVVLSVEGEGRGALPTDAGNLVARAALALLDELDEAPRGLQITCRNGIPLGSGLGSSAAAVLAGMLGVNALLGGRLDAAGLLERAAAREGHADNVAAALFGGLVVVAAEGDRLVYQVYELPRLPVAVVVPEMYYSTRAARAVLPRQVPLADAVFNMGRTALVVDALRRGDLDLLGRVMEDRLHQPHRLALIKGAAGALAAARTAGAAAVTLSGSGPGLIAFAGEADAAELGRVMVEALAAEGVAARALILTVSTQRATVVND